MYAPIPEKSSAGYTKIGWVPGGDLTSLVQGSWRQADDFYGELAARVRRHQGQFYRLQVSESGVEGGRR